MNFTRYFRRVNTDNTVIAIKLSYESSSTPLRQFIECLREEHHFLELTSVTFSNVPIPNYCRMWAHNKTIECRIYQDIPDTVLTNIILHFRKLVIDIPKQAWHITACDLMGNDVYIARRLPSEEAAIYIVNVLKSLNGLALKNFIIKRSVDIKHNCED